MWRSPVLAGLVALALTPLASVAQQPAYSGIPAGFDFPAAEARLLQLRDAEDVKGQRDHAWQVFAGMTQPSPGGEAIWETWYPSNVTMHDGPSPQSLIDGKLPRAFTVPRQFRSPGEPVVQAIGASALSAVMFNKEAHDFIRAKAFYRRSTLGGINAAFPAGTPVESRAIAAFPREAISLKLVWKIVKGTGLTPIPVWDFTPTQPFGQRNPEETWSRVVVVDPSRATIPANEVRDINWMGRPFPKSRVRPVADFYSFKVTPANVAAVQAAEPNAAVGDYAVLVGMHYTTKEIADWVWATFWWHDRADSGPFATDRPAAVKGVWRNYLMDVAYSMDTPREYDGTPNSAFNPYLEARFAGGMGSNCMTCHQRAVIDSQGDYPSFLPVTRGALPGNDPLFTNTTKLDFLWSLALESKPFQ